jgi:UrcA family protein
MKSAIRRALGVSLGGTMSLVVVATLAASLSPAYAAERAPEAPKYVVHYSDLDLATKAGAQALYWRIKWAAEDLCADPRGADSVVRVHKCIDQAVSRAVAEVNSPLVVGYYVTRMQHGAVLAGLP